MSDDDDDGALVDDDEVGGIAERVRERRRGPFGEATNSSPAKRGATSANDMASPKKRRTTSKFEGENANDITQVLASPTKRGINTTLLGPVMEA